MALAQIAEINKRRTKTENVSVEFNEVHGETRGLMVADAATYGTDKLWVILKGIPIDLDSDSSEPETPAESGSDDNDESQSTAPPSKRAKGS